MIVDVIGHLIADPAKLTVNISFQLYAIASYATFSLKLTRHI